MAGDEGGFVTVDGILALTSTGQVIFSSIGPALQNLPDLRAVPKSAYTDKQLRYVEDEGAIYAFDLQGVGADNGSTIIKPDDVGGGDLDRGDSREPAQSLKPVHQPALAVGRQVDLGDVSGDHDF